MKIVSGIVLLVAVLTLIVAPVTCSGGLLVHCCAPEDSDHGDDHHEHACPVDPCNRDTVIMAGKSLDDDSPDGSDSPSFLPADVRRPVSRAVGVRWTGMPLLVSSSSAASFLPLLC
ncbi:MAG: hypothetical protein GY838_03500 [bacterium]|nr:hypothetical protein [bacterium]